MNPFRFAFKAPVALRSSGLASLLLVWAALAAPSSLRADSTSVLVPAPEKDTTGKLLQTLEDIESMEGISIGGVFRGEFLNSSLRGPAVIPTLRSEESAEYSSVDFDIKARPNTATQGHVIFRMHEDWRNFFSTFDNPIFSRWISLDGKVKGMFSYDAGNFRQRYSPLTLYAPEVGLMYEPEIFTLEKQSATDEVFLGNNDRVLEGVNLNFDAAVDAHSGFNVLQELHLNVMGVRLRDVQTSIANGDFPTSQIEATSAEKYAASTNGDVVFMKGLSLGGTAMLIFDKKGTYTPLPGTDTMAENNTIFAGRAGVELGPMLDAENWSAGIAFEGAESENRPSHFPGPGYDTLPTAQFASNGSALSARVHGGWNLGDGLGLSLGADYIRNDSNYYNELAQSPTFIGQRIMNIENDTTRIRTDNVDSRNYSTFDAMYRTVFEFTPSSATNLWSEAPFQKLSYSNSIMSQSEMRKFLASRVDTSVQLVLPLGPATPNRTGILLDLTAKTWGGRIEAKALYTALQNVDGTPVTEISGAPPDTAHAVIPVTNYTQLGGGLKLEVGSMLGLSLPLTVAGSFIRSGSKNDGLAGDTVYAADKVTSDFLNAGFYYKIWKRLAFMGGYQQIHTTIDRGATETGETQNNSAGGAEYRVGAGAYLSGTLGLIDVTYSGGAPGRDFSQLATDVFLSVHF